MLQRLGFKRFAYDWRAEHVPTFDAEIDALKKHGIELDAFWFRRASSTTSAADPRRAQATRGQDPALGLLDSARIASRGAEQERRVEAAAAQARAARRRGRQDRLHASPSTTTAAGSASRRTRSPSSSG